MNKKPPNTRYQQLHGRRDAELEMWKTWDAGGRKPEHLVPLVQSLKPVIKREATKVMSGLGGSIPRFAVESELTNHAIRAIESYDPTHTSGAKLTTHIHNNFRRVTDFIASNRNMRRMPKAKVERYQTFQNALSEFTDQFGHEPSNLELQSLLPKWSIKEIHEARSAFAPEAFSGISELENDPGMTTDAHRSAVSLMRSRMTPDQQRFADMHYPPMGVKPLTVDQIAVRMNIPKHTAYRLRAKVDALIAPVIKGE